MSEKKANPSTPVAKTKSEAKAHSEKSQDASSSGNRTATPVPVRSKRGGISGVPGSLNDSRRCTAKANRTGERCKRAAIKGGTVCTTHGGATPRVAAKAKERLLALLDPALAALQKVLTDPNADDNTKVRAALGILDRTGHGPGAKIEIAGPSVFDEITMEALELDRSTGGGGKSPAEIEPAHSWEDADTFQRTAQGEAWRELDGEDAEAYATRLDPYDGNTVPGEVLSDSLLPDPCNAPGEPSEMTGGTVPFTKRKATDPPRYWPEDE